MATKLDQFKIEPPAPLTDKSRLLSDVRKQVDSQGRKLVRLWCGLDPSLHLIEAIMIETDDADQQVG